MPNKALKNKMDSLVNPALLRLGEATLATTAELDIDSSNPVEQLVALTIDGIISEVLELFPWDCVSKIDTSLTAISDYSPKDSIYNYAYKLPDDFIRIIGEPAYGGQPLHYSQEIIAGRNAWRIGAYSDQPVDHGTANPPGQSFMGQRVLETIVNSPYVEYVYRKIFTDESTEDDDYYHKMDISLRNSIQDRCRERWAFPITRNMGDEAQAYQSWKLGLKDASSALSQKGATPRLVYNGLASSITRGI